MRSAIWPWDPHDRYRIKTYPVAAVQ